MIQITQAEDQRITQGVVLTDLATRWTRDCTDIAQVIDLMVSEQFLGGLPT